MPRAPSRKSTRKSTRKATRRVQYYKPVAYQYRPRYVPRPKIDAGPASDFKKGVNKVTDRVIDKLGSIFGNIVGSGEYKMAGFTPKYNTILNSNQVPDMHGGAYSIRVKHREYIQDVVTSATPGQFDIQTFRIQPSDPKMYPWLAELCAGQFQKYRIHGQVLEFKSTSGESVASTNTALGTVVMSTNYDSLDPAFTTKQQMENTQYATSCKFSESMIHPIECSPEQTPLTELYLSSDLLDVVNYNNVANTLSGGLNIAGDLRLYDLGKFYLATQGGQAASVNIGELWVSYDIELINTVQDVGGAATQQFAGNFDPTVWSNARVFAFAKTVKTQGMSLSGSPLSLNWGGLVPGAIYRIVYGLKGLTSFGASTTVANGDILGQSTSNGTLGSGSFINTWIVRYNPATANAPLGLTFSGVSSAGTMTSGSISLEMLNTNLMNQFANGAII